MRLPVLGIVLLFIRLERHLYEANQFNTSESTTASNPTSGLYGYDISIQKIGGETSMMIGTPPSSPEKGHGNLQKCLISPSKASTAMRFECSPVPRPSAMPVDNIGQSLSTNPRTGEVLACSTTSAQICTNTVTLPGYCYLYSSTEASWKTIEHNTTRGCPVSSTVDVLFVLDGSGSVRSGNFDKIKDWTKAVTDELKVDEGIAKVAVIQFGSMVTREIQFDSYSQLSSLQNAISNIEFHNGGSTRTVDALEVARNVLEGSKRFGQKKNAQVMIILTDGKSSQGGVLEAARKTRDMGAVTYAVGVGSAKESELRELATGTNTDDRVYKVSDFDKLDTIVDSLQKQIETFIPTEGAGNLTVEMAQAGIGAAFTKNKAVTYKRYSCVNECMCEWYRERATPRGGASLGLVILNRIVNLPDGSF